MILCYNLKGTKKGRKIGMLGSFLGFRVRYVEKEDYSKTIGELAGLSSVEKEAAENLAEAIVTAKNQSWTSAMLYKEVKKEHEAMQKAEQEAKEKAKEKSE